MKDFISFAYEDDRVTILNNISFEVEAGQTIALVGPSGAGKTTLLNLIPRFYDPQIGTIKVDGTTIKDLKVKSLREHISIVPQEVHLFGTSIKDNIKYGNLNATDEEIMSAAIDANAHDFISEIPERL